MNASGDLTVIINEAAGCTIQRLEHVYTQYDSGGLSYPEGRTTLGPVFVSGSIGAINGTGGLKADNIGFVSAIGDVRGVISTTTRNYGSGNVRGFISTIESASGHIRATIGGPNTESITGLSAVNGTIGVPTGSFSSIAAVSSIGDIVAQSVRANIAVGYDSSRTATAQLRKLQTTGGGFTGILACNQLQNFGGSSSVGIDLAGTLNGLVYIRQDSILPISAASMTSTSQILIGGNLIGDIDMVNGLAGNVTIGRFGPVAWNGDVFAGNQTIA